MTNALVTGGAGFIGSALVRRLLKDGYSVRVLDDYSRGVPERLKDIANDIEMVQGDVRDYAQVDSATKNREVVFHLAAVNGTENFYHHPDRVLEVGVKGTMHTMDAAIRHGCRRYIIASSSEVYQQPTHCPTTEQERLIIPDPTNPRFSYASSKLIGELLALHYLARHGVEPVIFRPHNIYGPYMGYEHVIPQFFQRLLELQKTGAQPPLPFPLQGDGSQTRAFCYIDDAVNAIVLLAEKGNAEEIYHIGKEEETTIAEVAHLIAKTIGVSIELQPGEEVKGGTSRRCPDISKMGSLGFAPHISLAEGLQRTYEGEWMQKA